MVYALSFRAPFDMGYDDDVHRKRRKRHEITDVTSTSRHAALLSTPWKLTLGSVLSFATLNLIYLNSGICHVCVCLLVVLVLCN